MQLTTFCMTLMTKSFESSHNYRPQTKFVFRSDCLFKGEVSVRWGRGLRRGVFVTVEEWAVRILLECVLVFANKINKTRMPQRMVWAWRPPPPTPQAPPWVSAWKPANHAGIPPHETCKAYHPPPPRCTKFLTDSTKNITLPQTSFVGGKYS